MEAVARGMAIHVRMACRGCMRSEEWTRHEESALLAKLSLSASEKKPAAWGGSADFCSTPCLKMRGTSSIKRVAQRPGGVSTNKVRSCNLNNRNVGTAQVLSAALRCQSTQTPQSSLNFNDTKVVFQVGSACVVL